MFQFSRYRGLTVVALSIMVSLACIDVTLTATLGSLGRLLPSEEDPADIEVQSAVGGRISLILTAPERPGIGTETPLGILFGQSTLGAGINPRVLEEKVGLNMRWENLHGWGGSVNHIQPLTELFLVSGLKPDVVVIAINPYMLIGHPFEKVDRHMMIKDQKFLKPWIWLYKNRYLANHLFRHGCHCVKLGLLRMFDFSIQALYPAASESWPALSDKPVPPFTAEMQAERAAYMRALGWFDADQYNAKGPNATALVNIIREFRDRGAKVCIVLMPEQTFLRENIPSRAVQCFAEINQANFPDDPVPVYNLRDRMPDNVFRDYDHLAPKGSVLNTSLVGKCVLDLLSGHPAPEKFRNTDVEKAAGTKGTP